MVKIFSDNKIIDPNDKKSYSIFSTHGKKILKNYIKHFKKLKKQLGGIPGNISSRGFSQNLGRTDYSIGDATVSGDASGVDWIPITTVTTRILSARYNPHLDKK